MFSKQSKSEWRCSTSPLGCKYSKSAKSVGKSFGGFSSEENVICSGSWWEAHGNTNALQHMADWCTGSRINAPTQSWVKVPFKKCSSVYSFIINRQKVKLLPLFIYLFFYFKTHIKLAEIDNIPGKHDSPVRDGEIWIPHAPHFSFRFHSISSLSFVPQDGAPGRS